MTGGVYTITAPSGTQYVGSSVHIGKRFQQHKHRLRYGKHTNPGLTRAYKKYGEGGLVFAKLLVCAPEMRVFYEQRAIDILKPEYNCRLIADSNKGVKHSPEVIAAKSLLARGKKHSLESRARMSAATKGKPRSAAQIASLKLNRMKANAPEARAKWAKTVAKLQNSPEWRAKMADISKKYWDSDRPKDVNLVNLDIGRKLRHRRCAAMRADS